jgi:hypothetical protein
MERYFDVKFTSEEMVSWRNVGEILDSITVQDVPHDGLYSLSVREQRTAG